MKCVGQLSKGDGKVLQPGYPKIENSEENLVVRLVYMVGAKAMKSLPKIGDKYNGAIPISSEIEEVVLSRVTAEPKSEDGPWRVELEYTPEPLYDEVSGNGRNRVWKTYEMSTDDMDVPLEQHEEYQARWNHVLLAKDGVSAVPTWWETTADTVIADTNYKWGKPGEKVEEGWHVIKAETKPGVESFRDGVVTVTVTKLCHKRSGFDAEAKRRDYTVSAPGKTFGIEGMWLRGGSSIRREGRRWQMTTQFINSKYIDKDLYK